MSDYTGQVRIQSDYSSLDDPEYLSIIRRNDGDILFSVYRKNPVFEEPEMHIAMSGTRLSLEFRNAAVAFFEAARKEATINQNVRFS